MTVSWTHDFKGLLKHNRFNQNHGLTHCLYQLLKKQSKDTLQVIKI